MTVFQLMYLADGLYFGGGEILRHFGPFVAFVLINNMILPWVIALVLATVRSRAVQYAGFALQLVGFALHYAPYQIN